MDYLDELELIDLEYEEYIYEQIREEYLKSQNLEKYI